MRRCNPHRSNVAETRKPPRKRKTAEFAYGAAVFSIVATPASGNAISGISAVIPIGSASVSHSSAMSSPTAVVMRILAVKSGVVGMARTSRARTMQTATRRSDTVGADSGMFGQCIH
jgi:hypothetical protein